jgi:hypothetical protein
VHGGGERHGMLVVVCEDGGIEMREVVRFMLVSRMRLEKSMNYSAVCVDHFQRR